MSCKLPRLQIVNGILCNSFALQIGQAHAREMLQDLL